MDAPIWTLGGCGLLVMLGRGFAEDYLRVLRYFRFYARFGGGCA